MELAKDAGFEGIELALSADGPLNLNSTETDVLKIKNEAVQIGVELCSLATGLYWQYSLTSDRPDIRERAKQVTKRQIDIAALLGIDCVLVCPGAVGVDFLAEDVVPDAAPGAFFTGSEIIDYDIAYERARDAFMELAPYAENKNVIIGVENIWNKFLLSPLETRQFLDEIHSPYVAAFFDVGNVVQYGYPEQWIRILGGRIKKVHFKDYRRGAGGLPGFVDLLAGDVDWAAVMGAFEKIGYSGWACAEMCPPYKQHAEQLIYNTSAAMDSILGRRDGGKNGG